MEKGRPTGTPASETPARSLGEANQKTARLQQEVADGNGESILESIGDGFWVFDRSWRCTYINNRQAQLVGMSKEEILGKTVWELFPDLVGTEIYRQLHRAVGQQTPVHFEHFYPPWQGWFEIRVYPSANGVSILTIEITQRKQTEEALQDRQRFVQQLAEMSPGLLYLYDVVEQRNIYINARSLELLGYPSETILAMGAEFITQVMHPDDLAQMPAHFERLNTSGEGSFLELEYRVRHVNGEWRWFHSSDTVFSRTAAGQVRQILGTAQDITERKQAQEALRESEERFQAFMNHSPASAWIADEQGQLLYLSPTYFRMFNFPQLDAVGKNIFDIYTTEFAQQFIENNQRVFETKQVFETIEAAPRPDGSVGEFLVYKFPIATGSGETLLGGVAVDITERRQAEAALARSQQELTDFVENVAVGLHWVGADGTILWANQCELDLLGYSREEYIGHHIAEFHAEQKAIDDILQRLNRNETLCGYEARLRHKDGSIRYVSINSNVFWEEGKFVHTRCFSQDVTDRQRAEEALREREQRFSTLFNGMDDWVLVYHVTPDHQPGQFIEVNEQACRKLGYSREELLTMSVTDIIGSPLINPQASVEQLLAQKHVVVESVHTTKDGRHIPVEVNATLFTLNGLPTIQSICRDITQRKRAEAEREQLLARERAAREEAEAANRIKDEFLAVLSHELRSPLNPILGWTRLLRTRKFDEQARDKALETIERNALLQTQLIGDLLDVSRILQGKMALNVCPVNLASTIEAAIETVSLAAQAKNIQIQTQLDWDVEPICGDPGRLQQIVWNLLSNAVKFTPAGGQVEVRLQQFNVEGSDQLKVERLNVEGSDQLKVERLNVEGFQPLNVEKLNVEGCQPLKVERLNVEGCQPLNVGKLNVEGCQPLNVERLNVEGCQPLNVERLNVEGLEDNLQPTKEQQSTSYAQIQVKDTGIGISAEFLPHVFEYFRQENSTTTRTFGGLGLGLAIVRHLTELHGGTVRAESPGEGKGATFTVQLPLMVSTLAVPESKALLTTPTDLSQLQILVVDDEVDMRELVVIILQESGAVVRVAASATEALLALDQFQLDVLICDIGMPDVDGYMLIRQIRSRSPEQGGQIPAVALTAYAGEYDQRQALAAGFQLHISKPVEPEELAHAIANLIARGSPT